MTTLTNERLEDIASFAVSSELISMANELLSLRAQLAELEKQEPVAWIVGSEEIDEFKRGREVTVMRDGDEEELEKIALYAAPALPAASQPYTVPDERVAYESFIAKRLGGSIDTRRAKNGDPEKPDYMAWDMAVGWIAWQGRAAMLRPGNSPSWVGVDLAEGYEPDNSTETQDDTRRMNWLASHVVEVREPLPYGSHAMFFAQCDADDDEPYHTRLREQIDEAMLAAAQRHTGE
ncbi:hypothetical protein [Pectobacterium brasiliense]|uniref:hypothetical protein n=1 Tax=Pectobacterium brasiliense TaxID=180957 RepID=UPI000ACFCCA4|nr:hypothetical protein [Pectobacterium brasiliense]